jgi:flagellar basal-body rod protein FlgF
MSGSQYIALSGLRARADDLDRVAADIANVATAGYKGVREARASAQRELFEATLETAIDTTFGGSRLDTRAGAIAGTGRSLDLAIDGAGFFVVQTAGGERYTRNGHFTLDAERRLITEDGSLVLGEGGPITLSEGDGEFRVDQDGSVWSGTTESGRLKIVSFGNPGALVQEHSSRLSADGQTAMPITEPTVRAGSLEQSNVSVSERLAELTTVARGFEALQKALSVLMNDIDGRAIDSHGRRT